nr:unnamed protein product [Spirometra erinaceieuropaei]
MRNGQWREAGLRIRSPALFSLKFSAMLMNDNRDESPGIRIAFKIDGHLPSCWHMQASTVLPISTVHDPLLAGDCVLNIKTGEDVQRSVDLLAPGASTSVYQHEQSSGHAPTVAQHGTQHSLNQCQWQPN